MPPTAPRRCLIVAVVCALALAIVASPAAGARNDLRNVCGRGAHAGEIVTRAGSAATCKQALRVMRAWRRANDPRRFRSMRCGEVARTRIAFRDDKRYFATWQCRAGQARYEIWTRY